MASMRLSEAIRLGSLLHPQAFSVGHRHEGDVIATCALWAAMDAGYNIFLSIWLKQPQCPINACIFHRDELQVMIIHLNDDHRWTREAIADWVQGIEEAEALDANAPQEPMLVGQ